MTCEEALERISAALDGELSGRERRELDAHLDQCPTCDALFDELAGQSRLLRELECEVPEDLAARIVARLPRWRATPRFWRWTGTVAACLGLAVCLGAAVRVVTGWGTPAGQTAELEGESSAGLDESDSLAPYAFDDAPKSAGAGMNSPESGGVQYLNVVGTGDLSGRYIGSSTALEDLLARFDREPLASALGYAEDYFARAGLLAVSCQGNGTGVQPVVKEVQTVAGGYRVVLRQARTDGGGSAQDAWLILIEAENAAVTESVPSVEVVVDG